MYRPEVSDNGPIDHFSFLYIEVFLGRWDIEGSYQGPAELLQIQLLGVKHSPESPGGEGYNGRDETYNIERVSRGTTTQAAPKEELF